MPRLRPPRDSQAWRRLLVEEKRRRGAESSALVFVRASHVAQCLWSAREAAKKAITDELGTFHEWLLARVACATGTLPPADENGWLDVGATATAADALRVGEREFAGRRWLPGGMGYVGGRYWPEPPPVEDSLRYGEYLHDTMAERHPTAPWYAAREDLVLVGVPDGLTDKFVYEFKHTLVERTFARMLERARAQADLYGVIFGTTSKRVHVYVVETRRTYLANEPVDDKVAWALLEQIRVASRR